MTCTDCTQVPAYCWILNIRSSHKIYLVQYLKFIRTLKFYGFIVFNPCITDYPYPNTSVLISAGNKELNFRLQIQVGYFLITCIRGFILKLFILVIIILACICFFFGWKKERNHFTYKVWSDHMDVVKIDNLSYEEVFKCWHLCITYTSVNRDNTLTLSYHWIQFDAFCEYFIRLMSGILNVNCSWWNFMRFYTNVLMLCFVQINTSYVLLLLLLL